MKIDLEKDLPYVASVIGGLLGCLVTFLYLDEYLWLVVAVALFATLVFRFNPWAFIGSVLTGIAIELHTRGQFSDSYRVIFVILVGTGLELAARLGESRLRSDLGGAPFGRNVTFAWIGLVFSVPVQYVTTLAVCAPDNLAANLSETFSLVTTCQVAFVVTKLSEVSVSDGLVFWNTLALCIAYVVVQHPITWCCILATLSETRFRFYRVVLIIRKSFYGFLGIMAAFVVGYIPLLIGVAVSAGIASLSASLAPDEAARIIQLFMLVVNALVLFLMALGAAWGVSQGVSD
jgi:hypothetical protein